MPRDVRRVPIGGGHAPNPVQQPLVVERVQPSVFSRRPGNAKISAHPLLSVYLHALIRSDARICVSAYLSTLAESPNDSAAKLCERESSRPDFSDKIIPKGSICSTRKHCSAVNMTREAGCRIGMRSSLKLLFQLRLRKTYIGLPIRVSQKNDHFVRFHGISRQPRNE